MHRFTKPFLSRLWAFSAIVCMVAMLGAGFASVQSSVLNLEHQISGDVKLADGGWLSACDGSDGCQGHVETPEPQSGNDLIGFHHHHHSSESASGIVSEANLGFTSRLVTLVTLRPSEANRLIGRSPSTIDQPPRVLSRLS